MMTNWQTWNQLDATITMNQRALVELIAQLKQVLIKQSAELVGLRQLLHDQVRGNEKALERAESRYQDIMRAYMRLVHDKAVPPAPLQPKPKKRTALANMFDEVPLGDEEGYDNNELLLGLGEFTYGGQGLAEEASDPDEDGRGPASEI